MECSLQSPHVAMAQHHPPQPPVPVVACFSVPLSLCLCGSVALCLCVSVSLCLSVSLWLSVSLVSVHCDHGMYSVHPVVAGDYEVSTPGQDRTGDLQRVRLMS